MPGRDPLADPEPLLRRVYAYVAYRVGDPSDAEDVTSETFERALRYRDRYDERKGEPIAWLLGIARNCIYDAQLRPRTHVQPDGEPTRPGVDTEVIARLALEHAFATLSSDDQELLALRYGADLRVREIAGLLDRRTNAVEVALSRARIRLAAALEHGEAETQPGVEGPPAPGLADRAL
jgi:RNA polymerase sigma-70 factor (ECF subfamily)